MSAMLDATTISIPIRCGWRELYERFWRPEAFTLWASGLAEAGLESAGEVWRAEGPEGPVTIRFTPHNSHGVMDHQIDLGGDREVSMPMRVVPNGDCCLVSVTLFRQADMTDETFASDTAGVERDLQALKALAEAELA